MNCRNFVIMALGLVIFNLADSAMAEESESPTTSERAAVISKLKSDLKKERSDLEKDIENRRKDLTDAELLLGKPRWEFGYQVFKPSARVYFDSGSDDEGEIDLFDDGKFGLTLNFLDVYYEYRRAEFRAGPSLSFGISSSNDKTSDDAAVFVWGVGVSFEFEGAPIGLELGYMQGISADENLNSTTRDDGAFFVGITANELLGKRRLGGR